jgi:predicted nucleic acid-binding protein
VGRAAARRRLTADAPELAPLTHRFRSLRGPRIGTTGPYRHGVARYVIDAPTLLHVVTEGVAVAPEHQLVAPNLVRSQALALLLAAVRRGELTEKEALQRHERLTETKMRLLGDRVSRRVAWDIALQQGWDTTLEAEYLAVAKLQADALVTIDPQFAAKANGIVPVAPLTALTGR